MINSQATSDDLKAVKKESKVFNSTGRFFGTSGSSPHWIWGAQTDKTTMVKVKTNMIAHLEASPEEKGD
jgi:hypothetical protein